MANIGTTALTTADTINARKYEALVNQTEVDHPTFAALKANAASHRGGKRYNIPLVGGTAPTSTFTSSRSGQFTPVVDGDRVGSAEFTMSDTLVTSTQNNWRDLEENQGPTATVDLRKVHVATTIQEQEERIVTLLHTVNGSLPSGSFASFDTLCNDAVTSVGGISTSGGANPWWNPVTETTPVTEARKAIRSMFDALRRNGKGIRPSDYLVLTGITLWDAIRDELDAVSQGPTISNSARSADFAWESISYAGAEIAYDWDCPDDRVYFLHKPSLYFRWLNDLFMKRMPDQSVPVLNTTPNPDTVDLTFNTVTPFATVMLVGTNQRRNLGLIDGFTG